MEKVLMGIDIGTSACKTAVFDLAGRVIASSIGGYATKYPAHGFVEQDPEQWWEQVIKTIRACLRQIDGREIAAIGVDGQSWSCIAVDEEGNVLYPNPIWQDVRSAEICREINRNDWAGKVQERTGNSLQPFYSTGKILWIKHHEPAVYQRARWFLQSNSYIVYRLTGRATQDKSQCYGVHVYRADNGEPDRELCGLLGIDPDRLPPVADSSAVVGEVNESAAAATGLPRGIPVVAGGLDAACGTLGGGVFRHGQVQEQGGQAGGMSICLDSPLADPRLILSSHVVKGVWLLQGGTVGGGAGMRWIADLMGQTEEQQATGENVSRFRVIDQMAEQTPPGADGLIFLPYLMGERSPVWDSDACGVFFGLSFSTTKGHMYRAVMEGAAYSLRHNLEVAEQAGAGVKDLISIGGAAGSPFWMQIKADICKKVFWEADDDGFASARGVAVLAGLGAGCYSAIPDHIRASHTKGKATYPRKEYASRYDDLYAIYRSLYPNTREQMKERVKAVGDIKI